LADKELDKLVDAGVLRQVIPPYAASFDLKIERANFTSRSGVLGMEAVFVATVPAQHLNEVIQKLAQAR
jgi:hypothetical protein